MIRLNRMNLNSIMQRSGRELMNANGISIDSFINAHNLFLTDMMSKSYGTKKLNIAQTPVVIGGVGNETRRTH